MNALGWLSERSKFVLTLTEVPVWSSSVIPRLKSLASLLLPGALPMGPVLEWLCEPFSESVGKKLPRAMSTESLAMEGL